MYSFSIQCTVRPGDLKYRSLIDPQYRSLTDLKYRSLIDLKYRFLVDLNYRSLMQCWPPAFICSMMYLSHSLFFAARFEVQDSPHTSMPCERSKDGLPVLLHPRGRETDNASPLAN